MTPVARAHAGVGGPGGLDGSPTDHAQTAMPDSLPATTADQGGNVPDQIDRRSFLARGAATAAGLTAAGGAGGLLDACSSSSPKGSGGGNSNHGATKNNGISTATPKSGGSLTFAVEAEEQGFDPASARYDATGIIYARTVFDPLTTVAADGTIQPYLAQAVTPNADYSEWTIQMRPNVVFHDGTTCDAASVVGSLEHFLGGEYSFTAKPIEHITATGPLTVSVKMNQPWVPFDAYLAGGIGGQLAWVIPPSMIANKNGTNHPVGTGPFMFSEWVVNDHFTAKKNPHYWRPGLPYLDSITYKPIPESQFATSTHWRRVLSRHCTRTTRRASRTSAMSRASVTWTTQVRC